MFLVSAIIIFKDKEDNNIDRTYPHTAFWQAAAQIIFTTTSTGIKSITASFLPGRTRRKPLAQAKHDPNGPLKLSIQPGKGSFNVPITVNETTNSSISM
jgi:hypothetical protein